MVAVAVVAIPLSFWAKEMRSRRQSYLHDAARHERREHEERRNLFEFARDRRAGDVKPDDVTRPLLEKASRLRVPYHAAMKKVYLRAANHPWETVVSQPGEPGDDLIWQWMLIPPSNELNAHMDKIKEIERLSRALR